MINAHSQICARDFRSKLFILFMLIINNKNVLCFSSIILEKYPRKGVYARINVINIFK